MRLQRQLDGARLTACTGLTGRANQRPFGGTMRCTHCSRESAAGANFCEGCGFRLCTNCGTANPGGGSFCERCGFRFCPNCGKATTPAAAYCERCGAGAGSAASPSAPADSHAVPEALIKALTDRGMSAAAAQSQLLAIGVREDEKLIDSYEHVRIRRVFGGEGWRIPARARPFGQRALPAGPPRPTEYDVALMLITSGRMIFFENAGPALQLLCTRTWMDKGFERTGCLAFTYHHQRESVYLPPFWVLDSYFSEILDREYKEKYPVANPRQVHAVGADLDIEGGRLTDEWTWVNHVSKTPGPISINLFRVWPGRTPEEDLIWEEGSGQIFLQDKSKTESLYKRLFDIRTDVCVQSEPAALEVLPSPGKSKPEDPQPNQRCRWNLLTASRPQDISLEWYLRVAILAAVLLMLSVIVISLSPSGTSWGFLALVIAGFVGWVYTHRPRK